MFKEIITILGPTATGKTNVAVTLAKELDTEIVSADSRQVYKGMDIGTGKDIAEYQIDGQQIPYHLIDIAEPGTEYNIFQYQQTAIPIIQDIQQRGKTVILCGGSGMYVDALLKGYKLFPVPENVELRTKWQSLNDKELEMLLTSFRPLHNKTDIETRERLYRALEIEYYYQEHPELAAISQPVPSIIFGLCGNRDLIRSRITFRLKQRLEEGMIDEVQKLIDQGVSIDQLIRYGLEYKFITWYLTGKMDYQTMFDRLNVAIHQFSKRQMTWFRKMERDGFTIHWIDVALPMEEKMAQIHEIRQRKRTS
ncbi:tRNA (adenosine(37)-N6)-dimethylallyltransferase MiaA [Bacteroidales bacterium OttesenSCG-928-E04]|nr:tRNA (adenosine(37)-N6)-dimethylallyltransferase MiaA [Bacteroidales bacterium OttesenSCG-928-E04]